MNTIAQGPYSCVYTVGLCCCCCSPLSFLLLLVSIVFPSLLEQLHVFFFFPLDIEKILTALPLPLAAAKATRLESPLPLYSLLLLYVYITLES